MGAYVALFLFVWGLFSFLFYVFRMLYRFATSEKRRMQNELHSKRIAEEAKENRRIREENDQKSVRIRELEDKLYILEDAVKKLEAACAPLQDRYCGGELAYDYRDVSIYVPDENFGKIILGNPLFISRSKRNRYDKDAVSLNYSGEEIAYLYRGKMQEMALGYLSRGDGGYAIISHIDQKAKDVKVHLGFYKGCDFGSDTSNDDCDFDDL